MSEIKALFGQFLEIQKEQNEILKGIADKGNSLQFWRNSVEIDSHKRDCHNRPWDPSIAIGEQERLFQELAQLHRKYQRNQERLEELHKQLFAEVC